MDRTAHPLAPYPIDAGWQLRQSAYDPAGEHRDDTLFALANGSLGVRGGFEEGSRAGDGCFLAGAYERHPIHYHERFPGFTPGTDTRIPVADGKRIAIVVDGDPLDIQACQWLAFERVLDLKRGVLRRRLQLRTAQGACLQIDSERFVAKDQDLLAIRYRVSSVDFSGSLALVSRIDAPRHATAQGNDPRIGAVPGDGMHTLHLHADDALATLVQRTRHSGIQVACAQSHRLPGDGLRLLDHHDGLDRLGHHYTADLRPGDTVCIEKFVAYAAGSEAPSGGIDTLAGSVERRAIEAAGRGYDALEAANATVLSEFWNAADLRVEGDDRSQFALRFNLFHLQQSASRDPAHGTAAKGLTGEGYEGHCFWDTEAFVLPVMVFTAPDIARSMLLYRFRCLPAARANARELNHPRGALYPWRTIAGGECSAHYPTGAAAYHINAAIAYAIGLYLDASADEAFLLEAGAEMLFETARIWPQAGHFDPLRQGGFGIHGVTGPDEYSVLVDNNFYTNRMAQRHLLRAVQAWQQLAASHPEALQALAERLSLDGQEVESWQRIADAMLLRVDPQLDIYAQDDTFLHKPHWPHRDAQSGRPLLLHYHPLTLFRHQVSKQADLVMALFLAGDGLDLDRKRRSFDYYASVTTHDSTLSAAVHGIVASQLGLHDKAWGYFNDALMVDLDDLHHNTAHGVHMAAMAGSWLGMACGFAGLRVVDGELTFSPALPDAWLGFGFGLHWRGRRLRIDVSAQGANYLLASGEPLEILHDNHPLRLVAGAASHRPLATAARTREMVGPSTFPRRCRALIFDLDGVLTDTAMVHYRAWKRLADEIDVPFDLQVNQRLKGIDRAASLDIILERSERAYSASDKQALMDRKNDYYRQEIASFGRDDLFEGVAELLKAARDAGLRTALASASRNAPELLQRLGIADAFDHVVDASRVSQPKPHPETFLAAAAALDIAAAECIGIEDAAAGIQAIKAAGMAAVGIGDSGELSQADAVLPAISHFKLEDFVSTR